MDILLSSFCFNNANTLFPAQNKDFTYGNVRPREQLSSDDFYYRNMPPICFRNLGNSFEPDYSVFFLGDNFYVDQQTIDKVKGSLPFRKHAILFEALEELGRLKIVDYNSVITPHDDLILTHYNKDIANIADWKIPFVELTAIWKDFCLYAQDQIGCHTRHEMYELREKICRGIDYENPETREQVLLLIAMKQNMVPGLSNLFEVGGSKWDPWEDVKFVTDIYSPYLKHISATLCLSECLNATIHDWADLAPLYKKKTYDLLNIHQNAAFQEQAQCRQLIKIMFPHFQPKDKKTLIKILSDRRIDSLRKHVNDSVNNGLYFDNDYANRMFHEIIHGYQKTEHYKTIIGWLTMPLALIPQGEFIGKGIHLAAEKWLKNRQQKDKGWFFLLSEAM